MHYKDDIFWMLFRHSRGKQYDMTMPFSAQGILLEPSLTRIGFVSTNPFASVLQYSLEVIDSNNVGIVLPPQSGPHFFSVLNCFGSIRQRWHFRGEGVPATSRWSVVEFHSDFKL